MGMYTVMHLQVRLSRNMPHELRKFLEDPGSAEPLDHPFFRTSRWRACFFGRSYYFNTLPRYQFEWDDVDYWLNLDANIKNYGNEWKKFLNLLEPHLPVELWEEFVGYLRYEEDDHPTGIYTKDGKFRCVKLEPKS